MVVHRKDIRQEIPQKPSHQSLHRNFYGNTCTNPKETRKLTATALPKAHKMHKITKQLPKFIIHVHGIGITVVNEQPEIVKRGH